MGEIKYIEKQHMISAIQIPQLYAVWADVEPILERVVEESHGDISVRSTRNRLIAGELQLYVISRMDEIDAIFVTDVQLSETGQRVLLVPIIGGNNMDAWIDDAIFTWRKLAEELMCDRIIGLGRKGWERKLKPHGLKVTHVNYELEM
jgi:hypothetical protein